MSDGPNAQPVGAPLPGWTPRAVPPRDALVGRFCRLEPIEPARHGDGLFNALAGDGDATRWTYLPYGPFTADQRGDFDALIAAWAASADPQHFVICAPDGRVLGTAAFMRIDRAHGVIEIGHVGFGPNLARTPAATEAIYLMLRRAFDDLGYRRCEWKCDSLNAPSRRAAERFGFVFEGVFRQAIVYKDRNRDTAWHALIDGDWPARRAAFEAWLTAENFDAAGRQIRPLGRA